LLSHTKTVSHLIIHSWHKGHWHCLSLSLKLDISNGQFIIRSNASAECMGSGFCSTQPWPFGRPSQNQNNQSSSQPVQCTPTAEDFLALLFLPFTPGICMPSRGFSRSFLVLVIFAPTTDSLIIHFTWLDSHRLLL
jgi:hypothetical protein